MSARRICIAIGAMTALFHSLSFGQFPRYVNIFNFSTDARHVAMGGDAEGALEGPSLIFPQRDMLSNDVLSNSFEFRPPHWNTDDPISFHTISVQKAGVYIARNVSGALNPISLRANTFHGNVEPYQLYFVGYFNTAITEDLSFGASGKIYSGNNSPFIFFGISSAAKGRVQGTAYVMDVAVQKKITVTPEEQGLAELLLRAGVSNIGSDIVYNDNISFRLPRSLHLEALLSERTEEMSFVYKVHTRVILNPGSSDEHVYLNGGFEAGYLDKLFGRVGIIMRPYDSIFGKKNAPQFTAGAGFRLGNSENVRDSKFIFSFDIAIVPLTTGVYPDLPIRSTSPNIVFTAAVTYPIAWTQPR
jgi:hypothetical protein